MNEPITAKDLQDLQASIATIEKKVDRALQYLYEDGNTKTPGLVQDVRQLKRDVEEMQEDRRLEKKINQRMGVWAAAIVTILWEVGRFLFSIFTQHK